MANFSRIVITRQLEQGRPWVDQLSASGHDVLELPLLKFEQLEQPKDLQTSSYDWILFTSPNGVNSFIEAGLEPGSAKMGALGLGTHAAMVKADLKSAMASPHSDGLTFAAAVIAGNKTLAKVLIPGPVERRQELPQALTKAGFSVQILDLYRTVAIAPADLPDQPFNETDIVFFCSPSTVKAFVAKWDLRPEAIAIGQTTAETLTQFKFSHRVAKSPDLAGMVQAAGLDLNTSFNKNLKKPE